ncbi:ATP-dependent DNA helicase RecG [Paraflavitalea sp. CAU 1676]|uniref:ATP-dependent DNA helicase RecG n=1 Tax=Paraflavitalea sp. CAU 1676 TaxID=3032598 RepID=UPI0023D9B83C|nr:ATP-dependent DNA helicase RecG [Paraflavitalea sp. CAU 1676]MDF2187615.1 ATP-dependent DNA helicase RecG [Paraflavitalea sp. CAU 1676]
MKFSPVTYICGKVFFISSRGTHILASPIEYLKGVGPQRAELLQKELGIYTFKDLLEHFPYRHIDKTKVSLIRDISPMTDFIQIAGRVTSVGIIGEKRSKRLVAELRDSSGTVELTWFQGITWIQKMLSVGQSYQVFGKVSFFQGTPQLTHPEIESLSEEPSARNFLEPVYSTTEKLKARGLGARQIAKLTQALFLHFTEKELPENLPNYVIKQLQLVPRYRALSHIHFPPSNEAWQQAMNRLKFEEFFIAQLRMNLVKSRRHRYSRGVIFGQVGEIFNTFYDKYLPFELTGAQKRVIKEIRKDTGSGRQMNRLLQGDVGSGKTIVALLVMLLAADNGYQSCLMAPTEILARQHFAGLTRLLKDLPVNIRILTGNTKAAERRQILKQLEEGEIQLIVGTHALLEDTVKFKNIGIAIVDEQHRFGVAQRAKLWAKAPVPPHMLVMTATPIPRTLAMTAYGDLDYSVMDELPPNRKPILTVHRYDTARSQVMGFIKAEIAQGRQAYIVFPLIEESEKLDYENLMKGYENVKAYFPEPKYWMSMVHGRQTNDIRETNMQRFKNNDTQILVATTVIEVGVDVPNASVMVIENAEKFGLSQLHQLRGRVGRGAEKSFCILLTGSKLNNDARERIKTMCDTTDGFKVAEKDLELRGPGDIEGTRQSGMLNFKLANIVQDRQWLEAAREVAEKIAEYDPELSAPENGVLKEYLQSLQGKTAWSKIS